jgi:hypothetical protein
MILPRSPHSLLATPRRSEPHAEAVVADGEILYSDPAVPRGIQLIMAQVW